MKSIKKICCSLLLLFTLILCFSTNANAGIPVTKPPIEKIYYY